MVKTINLQLTLAQADELSQNLKKFADMIQGKSVGDIRPLSPEEDLLIAALSWLKVDIESSLSKHNQKDIQQQRNLYKRSYLKCLMRQAQEN
jgi:hypothetical protein